MKILHKKLLLCIAFTLILGQVLAQKSENNFYSNIKNYDISTVLTTDSIIAEDRESTKEKLAKSEPIGFIGNDYQRFYIRFSSVARNPNNPYEYIVLGKTKVKDIIRPFKGTIVIQKATLSTNEDFPNYKSGFATCKVNLQENNKLTSTGVINGQMTIGYVINAKKKLSYDALLYYADGFSNNGFKGTWTSYRTKVSKKCNFGDYRIPESGDLDVGAGEFSPNPKYFDKGWKYYMMSLYGETEKDVDMGKKKEKMKWWK